LHAETKRRQGRRSRKKSPGRQPTAVSRDESRLVTISWDNKVRWWDITKPEPVMHPAIALFCVTRDHHQFATRPKKKTNVVQHLLVFHHIGLLVNEPSSERFGWSVLLTRDRIRQPGRQRRRVIAGVLAEINRDTLARLDVYPTFLNDGLAVCHPSGFDGVNECLVQFQLRRMEQAIHQGVNDAQDVLGFELGGANSFGRRQ
jgi:hypothetical protein